MAMTVTVPNTPNPLPKGQGIPGFAVDFFAAKGTRQSSGVWQWGTYEFVGEAKDFSKSLTRDELEDTTIDTGGWKHFIQGLAEASIDFTMLRKIYDDTGKQSPGAKIVRDAFMKGYNIRVMMVTRKTEFMPNQYGWQAECAILDMSEDWPSTDVISNSVSCRVSGEPEQIDTTEEEIHP